MIIRYDLDELTGVVGCYEQQVAILREEMSNIRRILESVAAIAWHGAAADSYMQRYELVNLAHEMFIQRVDEAGNILKQNTTEAIPVLSGINQLGRGGAGYRFGLDTAAIQDAETTVQGMISGCLPSIKNDIRGADRAVIGQHFRPRPSARPAESAAQEMTHELQDLLRDLTTNRQRTEDWDNTYASHLESALHPVRLTGTTWSSMGDLMHLLVQMRPVDFDSLSLQAQAVKFQLLLSQIDQIDDQEKREALEEELRAMFGYDWSAAEGIEFDWSAFYEFAPLEAKMFIDSLLEKGFQSLATDLAKSFLQAGAGPISAVFTAQSFINYLAEGYGFSGAALRQVTVAGTTKAGAGVGKVIAGPPGAFAGGVVGLCIGVVINWDMFRPRRPCNGPPPTDRWG